MCSDKNVNMDEVYSTVNIALDDLESSKLLFERGKYRNSVALSYYAMYSMARALLLLKDAHPSTHSGTIHIFGKFYVNEDDFDKELASDFSHAEDVREDASYANFDVFDKSRAIEYLDFA